MAGAVWKKACWGRSWLRLDPPPPALVEDLLRNGVTSPHTVSGGWAAWVPWSSCSRDCELGFRFRKRTCTNPEPRNGGLPCVGDANEYQDCNPQACPGNPAPGKSWPRENPVPSAPYLGDAQAYPGYTSFPTALFSLPIMCKEPQSILLPYQGHGSYSRASGPVAHPLHHLFLPNGLAR